MNYGDIFFFLRSSETKYVNVFTIFYLQNIYVIFVMINSTPSFPLF